MTKQIEQTEELQRLKTLIYFVRIQDLELSTRTYNGLRNDFFRLSDLVTSSRRSLLKMTNLGKMSVDEIENLLKSLGLEFEMKLPDEVFMKAERLKNKAEQEWRHRRRMFRGSK